MSYNRRQFLAGAACLLAGGASARTAADESPVTLHFFTAGGRPWLQIGDAKPIRLKADLAMVRHFRELVPSRPEPQNGTEADLMGPALYGHLWLPLQERSLTGRTLFIQATDEFSGFPFEGLRPDRDGLYVGRSARIRYLASGTRQAPSPDQSTGKNCYIYAPFPHGAGGLAPLPSTLTEASRVARALKGEVRRGAGANTAQFERDTAQPFSILHLATHGVTAAKSTPEPGLYLRGRGGAHSHAELLTLSHIRQRELRGRLVVLSACGASGSGGDAGGMALAEAFVNAGVTEVIAARWCIDDTAALEFMMAFYRGIERHMDAAVALRYARSCMVKDGYFSTFTGPYYWAAFVSVVGSPEAVLSAGGMAVSR